MKTHDLFEAEEQKGLTAEEKKVVRKRMIELIVSGSPSDLDPTLSQPWFYLNQKNQVVWNWRNREYPLRLLIEKEFPEMLSRWRGGPDDWMSGWSEGWRMADSVLNSKAVKAFKRKFKEAQGVVASKNAYQEVQQIDREIARLQARREKLLPLSRRWRRTAYAQKRQSENP